MLADSELVAFAASTDLDRTQGFYEGVLGLHLLHRDGYACLFTADARGTKLRVTLVDQVANAPYTVLGWEVPEIDATVKRLTMAGVVFQRYEGMDQDELGIWTAPDGGRVAWLKDPDGNTLSVSQPA
jgi:catechol 2,3-dioxygenase-like lactoylglutathione lyase family enzyme